jgi:hypothetical protein
MLALFVSDFWCCKLHSGSHWNTFFFFFSPPHHPEVEYPRRLEESAFFFFKCTECDEDDLFEMCVSIYIYIYIYKSKTRSYIE